MADNDPGVITEEESNSLNTSLSDFEQSLFSCERLDRSSPELWPEKIPGISDFIALHTPPNNSKPIYSKEFSVDDSNLLHQFAALSTSGLIAKVKELHDIAYQLGVEEAKEMTRGKYLNLFKRTNPRLG